MDQQNGIRAKHPGGEIRQQHAVAPAGEGDGEFSDPPKILRKAHLLRKRCQFFFAARHSA